MVMMPDKYRGTQVYSLVYCRLLASAKEKEGLSYQEIAEIMGVGYGGEGAREVGHLLAEINEDEHNNGRPLLSAVAVDPITKMPGEGFFAFAAQLQKFKGDTEEDKREFWWEEIQAVYATW
jgi:hypothetical protein